MKFKTNYLYFAALLVVLVVGVLAISGANNPTTGNGVLDGIFGGDTNLNNGDDLGIGTSDANVDLNKIDNDITVSSNSKYDGLYDDAKGNGGCGEKVPRPCLLRGIPPCIEASTTDGEKVTVCRESGIVRSEEGNSIQGDNGLTSDANVDLNKIDTVANAGPSEFRACIEAAASEFDTCSHNVNIETRENCDRTAEQEEEGTSCCDIQLEKDESDCDNLLGINNVQYPIKQVFKVECGTSVSEYQSQGIEGEVAVDNCWVEQNGVLYGVFKKGLCRDINGFNNCPIGYDKKVKITQEKKSSFFGRLFKSNDVETTSGSGSIFDAAAEDKTSSGWSFSFKNFFKKKGF